MGAHQIVLVAVDAHLKHARSSVPCFRGTIGVLIAICPFRPHPHRHVPAATPMNHGIGHPEGGVATHLGLAAAISCGRIAVKYSAHGGGSAAASCMAACTTPFPFIAALRLLTMLPVPLLEALDLWDPAR